MVAAVPITSNIAARVEHETTEVMTKTCRAREWPLVMMVVLCSPYYDPIEDNDDDVRSPLQAQPTTLQSRHRRNTSTCAVKLFFREEQCGDQPRPLLEAISIHDLFLSVSTHSRILYSVLCNSLTYLFPPI